MLSSITALVFFLYGGLGFPNLHPLPPEKPPALIQPAASGLPPEQIGKRVVELTQRLEFASSPVVIRDLLQMASLSDPKLQAQINLLIKKYAKRHGVDEKLIRAVLQKESGGNPIAVSPKGAMGLMQLMPETAQSLGVEDPFDPEQNLAGGIRYLKYCLNTFAQDVALALAAYNAGPETVKRYGGVPPYTETQNYVAGILGCPVEDLIKKDNAVAEGKGQDNKTTAANTKDPKSKESKSAVNLPKPNWKVVQADVTVPTIKWKISPALTVLNPIPLKINGTPEAAKLSKDASRPSGDAKEAASAGPLSVPKLLNNYGYR